MPQSLATRILVPACDRQSAGASTRFTLGEAQTMAAANRYRSLSAPRKEALRAFLSGINGQGFAADILRLTGDLLASAKAINASIFDQATSEAFERYSGPLYTALDFKSLASSAAKRGADELVIVSPLFGLLGARDLIPNYRCPVGAQIPGFGSLHTYWKPRVSPILDRICRGRLVFSFLPRRMQALWTPKPTQRMVTISFAHRHSGGARPEHAGAARIAGELVRAMLESDWRAIEPLERFVSTLGHRFDPRLSSLEEPHAQMVFVR